MKDKAIKIIESYENKTNAFYLHTVDKTDVINMMLEFGHYVAEEQKKQCATEAKLLVADENGGNASLEDEMDDGYLGVWFTTVSKDSILNSKNVCNEQ